MHLLYQKDRFIILTTLLLMSSITFSQRQYYLVPADDSTISISPNMVGFNNQMASKNEPWSDAGRLYSLEKSSIGLLRYPGGTVSNYWDMENERLFQNSAAIDTTNSNPRQWLKTENVLGWVVPTWPARNSINNLKRAYNSMAASGDGTPSIIYVLNMITPGADFYSLKWNREIDQSPYSDDWWKMMNDRLSRNISMLDKVVAGRMDLKYIEFGNEYYFGRSNAGGGANGGAIVEPYSAGAFNTSLEGAFPGNGEAYATAVNNWADTLKKRYPGIKLCAIGAVANSTNPSRRNSWNTNVVSKIDTELVPAVSLHVYGGVDNGNLNSNEENLGRAFESWLNYWEWIKDYSSLPYEREFWFTEYNSNQNKKSWGHGLMNIFILHNWITEGNLGLTNYHQFAQNSVSGFNLYASTRALAMIAEATRGKTKARQLKLNNEVYVEGTDGLKIPAVIAWRFGNQSENSNYFITNFSSDNIEIDITNVSVGEYPHYTIAHSSLEKTIDPEIITQNLGETIKLPPYSCVLFEGGEILPVNSNKISTADKNIMLYPNPGHEMVSFQWNSSRTKNEVFYSKVFDINGTEVIRYKGSLKSFEKHLNNSINNLNSGIYFISIENDLFTEKLKWIKK